jgi:hypothetical protein
MANAGELLSTCRSLCTYNYGYSTIKLKDVAGEKKGFFSFQHSSICLSDSFNVRGCREAATFRLRNIVPL